MPQGIADAPDRLIGDDVARHTNHEQVPKALVKYQLDRHTRIAATKDRRNRLLSSGEMLPPVGRLMRMPNSSLGEAAVPVFQARQRFLWILRKWLLHGRLIALRGVKLAKPERSCSRRT